VQATLIADTKSGTPGSDAVKVNGVITWVGVNDAVPAEVRLYERLFVEAHPDAGGQGLYREFDLNSLTIKKAYVEPVLSSVGTGQRFQFERHGYFVADIVDHQDKKAVFNRVTAMKNSFVK
jgi:glutaminyl-tRNA synthetase